MDFLRVSDLGAGGLPAVLDQAAAVKRDRAAARGTLAGLRVGLFFEKPSTRTRVSCEVAITDLGAVPLVLKQDEVGLGTREAVADVARVLDRYLDVLAFRVFHHRDLDTIAANAEAPVINLLSDLEHPCQALADLQTLAETRPLDGAVMAYVGDGNNVCASLMIAGAAMRGIDPGGGSGRAIEPAADVVAAARAIAASGRGHRGDRRSGGGGERRRRGLHRRLGVDGPGGRGVRAARACFEPYRVDERLFALAAPTAIFLHCLPAHRGDEVTDGVIDHERSRVFDQAENRLHAFKALLLHLAR